MVLVFEADPDNAADPYYTALSGKLPQCSLLYIMLIFFIFFYLGLTKAQIRLQLAEEEDKDTAQGNLSLHNVTPSGILAELLEIEDTQ
jgi:hypothetical protein